MPFCIAALHLLLAQAPKVTLGYFQEHFIVRDGVNNESAPLKLPPESPKLSTVFRRNSTFAVWDERGLTIRISGKVRSSKLDEVATSPKAFPRDEIRRTLDAIKKGTRSRDVAGLSGAVRVGNRVFFLGRWEDRDGKPWAEALVQVDLSEKSPAPKLVGRVPALSDANKPIDDKLFILDGLVTYVVHKENQWGLEQFNVRNNRFSFDPLGDKLVSYLPVESKSAPPEHVGLFIEKTSYGTTIAGRIDLHSRTRKILAEGRGKMRFIDSSDPPCIVLSSGNTATILSTVTGAEVDLPVPSATRRTSRGIVIWTPIGEPKRAWLYDVDRWQVRAWWNASQTPNNP